MLCRAEDGCQHRTGGPVQSWSASSSRTLAEDRARGVSGRPKAVAANSGASVPPEVAIAAAKKRVGGLDAAVAALAAVGTIDGPEVQFLKECLQKARRAAQERPINALLSQTEAFVERARKRLQAHDAARQQLVQELEKSEGRLSRLQEAARTQEATVQPTPEARSDTATQVQLLQQMLNKLQEERDALAEELHGPVERPQVRQRVSPSHIPEVVSPCRR